MRIALRCLFIIVFLLWGFLDLIDLPEQITQVLGLPDQISPYLTDRMLSVAVLVVGLALFGWSVFGEQVLKKLGVRGSIKVRFPAYRPLEDDPPLTVFAPASRWGENKICRIWRLEISNNGSQSIADLNVLISGRGRQRGLPIDCQRLGLLDATSRRLTFIRASR